MEQIAEWNEILGMLEHVKIFMYIIVKLFQMLITFSVTCNSIHFKSGFIMFLCLINSTWSPHCLKWNSLLSCPWIFASFPDIFTCNFIDCRSAVLEGMISQIPEIIGGRSYSNSCLISYKTWILFSQNGSFVKNSALISLEIEGGGKIWKQDQNIRLQHVDTGGYLHSHNKKYTRIAGGQQEVIWLTLYTTISTNDQ